MTMADGESERGITLRLDPDVRPALYYVGTDGVMRRLDDKADLTDRERALAQAMLGVADRRLARAYCDALTGMGGTTGPPAENFPEVTRG
jgi:hypothetical protein